MTASAWTLPSSRVRTPRTRPPDVIRSVTTQPSRMSTFNPRHARSSAGTASALVFALVPPAPLAGPRRLVGLGLAIPAGRIEQPHKLPRRPQRRPAPVNLLAAQNLVPCPQTVIKRQERIPRRPVLRR